MEGSLLPGQVEDTSIKPMVNHSTRSCKFFPSGKVARMVAKAISSRTRREVKKAVTGALNAQLIALGLETPKIQKGRTTPAGSGGTLTRGTTSKTTATSLKLDQISFASSLQRPPKVTRHISLEQLDNLAARPPNEGHHHSWVTTSIKVQPEAQERRFVAEDSIQEVHEVKGSVVNAAEEEVEEGACHADSSNEVAGPGASTSFAGSPTLPKYSALRPPPLRSPRSPAHNEGRSGTLTCKVAQSQQLSDRCTPSEQSTTFASVVQSYPISGRSVSCPSNAETNSCSPPCKRGGYSDVRSWRTEALVEQGIRRGSDATAASRADPFEPPINAYEVGPASILSDAELRQCPYTKCASLLLLGVRLAGVLPWQDRSKCRMFCRPSTYYQWSMMLMGCIASYACAASFFYDTESMEVGELHMVSDMPLALGSIAGLIAAGAYGGSHHVASLRHLLLAFAHHEDGLSQWMYHSCWDLGTTWLLWVLALCSRLAYACVDDELTEQQKFQVAGSIFACTVVMALCGFTMYICRALYSLIDIFCVAVHDWALEELEWTVRTWNVLQAMLRKSSGTIQSCLFVLQVVAVSTFFFLAVDLARNWPEENYSPWRTIFAVLPGLLVIFEIGRVLHCAAAVTDKCTQLPSLINSMGETLDAKRQAVVQYVAVSAAGFHVYEVRVDSGLLVKCLYLCCVAAFAIATQVGRHS